MNYNYIFVTTDIRNKKQQAFKEKQQNPYGCSNNENQNWRKTQTTKDTVCISSSNYKACSKYKTQITKQIHTLTYLIRRPEDSNIVKFTKNNLVIENNSDSIFFEIIFFKLWAKEGYKLDTFHRLVKVCHHLIKSDRIMHLRHLENRYLYLLDEEKRVKDDVKIKHQEWKDSYKTLEKKQIQKERYADMKKKKK